ncbi:sugar ABC transporter substrate-binding protein [Cryobacterium sp. Hh7]|uniref:substrate-binding domain-containing protein n=1 Tax=Cryobacterium sp. Hh7 TaxID=1259159 RepID=UPI0010698293|nr:substrate-binding domain-containing protein [Cryobacterium sp. Hh7]TFD52677.1 sugar ABC transporter substrate-binding protein [Cryobacterium sp. Hh7]
MKSPNAVRRNIRFWKSSAVLATAVALGLTGCASSPGATDAGASDAEEEIGVSLIIKTSSNPFFVAMQAGAESAAAELGVKLTVAAGRDLVDEDTQIQAIENAIAQGQKGILITPNGPSVLNAIEQARDAGLYVIALDDPPNPADAVDITFATDNRMAGNLIGEWTAGALKGEDAVIALIDLSAETNASVDFERDQGFLEGMGIDTNDPDLNGDEDATGSYSGGAYEIVCNQDSDGAEDGGRTAMETCLSLSDDINVVYTINEPAAAGAYEALSALGKESGVLFVSVDGGCAGVGLIGDGVISATSQQYPLKMAELGVEAIHALVTTGQAPENTNGLDFFNTGVALITDQPVDGVTSLDSAKGAELCWG